MSHVVSDKNAQAMFDLLTSLGAELNAVNRRGLTPFTLAATLARSKVSQRHSLSPHIIVISSLFAQ